MADMNIICIYHMCVNNSCKYSFINTHWFLLLVWSLFQTSAWCLLQQSHSGSDLNNNYMFYCIISPITKTEKWLLESVALKLQMIIKECVCVIIPYCCCPRSPIIFGEMTSNWLILFVCQWSFRYTVVINIK